MEKSNRRGLYIQQVEILGFFLFPSKRCFEENLNRNVNFDYFRQCWGVGGRCRKGKCLCSVNMHINIQGQCIGVIFFITSFLLDMDCTRICKICSKFTMWAPPPFHSKHMEPYYWSSSKKLKLAKTNQPRKLSEWCPTESTSQSMELKKSNSGATLC